MLRSDDRFARQNRFGLPPWFPVASPCPSIDHHLSGRVLLALDQSCIYSKTVRGCETPFWRSHHKVMPPIKVTFFTFISRVRFQWATTLASNSHSLVRVSRRAEESIEFEVMVRQAKEINRSHLEKTQQRENRSFHLLVSLTIAKRLQHRNQVTKNKSRH